jgi:hypothetical protein
MADLQEDTEIAALIHRATQIQEGSGDLSFSKLNTDEFVRAAEEAGISREATLQALRERLQVIKETYGPGQFAFAKSGDQQHYVVKILSGEGDTAKVRFMSGGEATVHVADLRPFNLGPGTKLEYMSPSWNMWLSSNVLRFNAETQVATFNYWGNEETVPLDQIRIARESVSNDDRLSAWLFGAACTVGGGILGALITYLVMR